MPNISRTTVILIILGLLVLSAAGYLLLNQGELQSGVTLDTPAATSAEQTFIALTAQLDPVSFDTSILSDSRFAALVDMRTIIVPEPTGRPDPFAPLPGVQ
ncbi:hypothetical protein L0Y34_01835 [Candidatus Parcubacteria bacterium]|nr:hypothetical protein [Candidatus Parcubacteria bacterium]